MTHVVVVFTPGYVMMSVEWLQFYMTKLKQFVLESLSTPVSHDEAASLDQISSDLQLCSCHRVTKPAGDPPSWTRLCTHILLAWGDYEPPTSSELTTRLVTFLAVTISHYLCSGLISLPLQQGFPQLSISAFNHDSRDIFYSQYCLFISVRQPEVAHVFEVQSSKSWHLAEDFLSGQRLTSP